ncbi:hypothetical protein EBU71_17575 [bacterium]|nr:hypothetical protein [Candidatus Elulimicrobium humile]
MTSAIVSNTIDTAYPIPGRDNDSQGFRDNFSTIKTALQVASNEISALQAGKADLTAASNFSNNTQSTSTNTGAVTVVGGVGIGGNLNVGGVGKIAGADIITTATNATFTNTDILFFGTYGQPIFRLGSAISGQKFINGTLAVGGTAAGYPTDIKLYTSTTSTNETALFVKTAFNNCSGIVVETNSSAGGNFNGFLTFQKNTGSPVVLGIFTHDGSNVLFQGGNLKTVNSFILGGSVPATSTSTGQVGEIAVGATYLYVCTGTNAWARVALDTTPF